MGQDLQLLVSEQIQISNLRQTYPGESLPYFTSMIYTEFVCNVMITITSGDARKTPARD